MMGGEIVESPVLSLCCAPKSRRITMADAEPAGTQSLFLRHEVD
jgi:hypothetical protein